MIFQMIGIPGSCSRARWLEKLNYCLQMYLIREQFQLNRFDLDRLREFNKFVVKIYAEAWFSCPNAVMAPLNDLNFLKKLVEYEKENKQISVIAYEKFSTHLWYLNEVLVGLAFFDDRISIEEKKNMVRALKIQKPENYSLRATVKKTEVTDKNLSDFVSSNTLKFFEGYEIKTGNWISKDPSMWHDVDEYNDAKFFCLHLNVVNDAAERAVKLVGSFINKSKDDINLQNILQVTEQDRKKYPNAKKSTLFDTVSSKTTSPYLCSI